MRVVVTNTVSLNAGDAAILYALIASVREAYGNDSELTIYDSQAAVARRLHPALTFRSHLSLLARTDWPWSLLPERLNPGRLLAGARGSRSWLLSASEREALAPWRAADVVISSGGTYLVEQYDPAPRLLDFRIARRLGKPLILFTQSVGRFRDAVSRKELSDALGYARLILVRETESHDNLRALGVSSDRIRIVADAAFALADVGALARGRDKAFPERGARIAVSVRDWPYFRTKTRAAGMAGYSEAVAALVRHLVAKGHRVTFLSTCQGVSEYWTDDSATARRILNEAHIALGEQVEVDARARTPPELIAELGTFDAVVATRMHAAILALSAGTPVLAIDYEDKARRLFQQLGVPEWTLDIETATPEGFCAAWDDFASAIDTRRPELLQAVTAQATDARSTVGLLRSAVVGGAG